MKGGGSIVREYEREVKVVGGALSVTIIVKSYG